MLGETLQKRATLLPRLSVPAFFRPAPQRTGHEEAPAGTTKSVCMFSDEAVDVGQHLDVELFVKSGPSLRTRMVVTWIKALAANAPARFDVGLEILSLRGDARAMTQAFDHASG